MRERGSFEPRAGLRRRAMLWSGGAAAALAYASGLRAETPRLRDLARAKGLTFGSEVLHQELAGDPAYAALVADQCGSITPGWEAKWDHVEPRRGEFNFVPLDRLVEFAEQNGQSVRMHTLIWSLAMPDWLKRALSAGDGRAALVRHIGEVVGRYRGRVQYWDVANEVSDPAWRRGPEGLTFTPWRKALGPEVIPDAFRLVHAADSQAKLFLNEDGLEYEGRDRDEKRATYLRLVESWRAAGVPLHGFGLEAHLRPDLPFAEQTFRRFLRELAGLGLELHVTELDVQDRTLPADLGQRDQAVADLCRRFLDVALDEKAVRLVASWGLTDRYSYQNEFPEYRRPDQLRARGLPWDDQLQPKAMWHALAQAFAHAPER